MFHLFSRTRITIVILSSSVGFLKGITNLETPIGVSKIKSSAKPRAVGWGLLTNFHRPVVFLKKKWTYKDWVTPNPPSPTPTWGMQREHLLFLQYGNMPFSAPGVITQDRVDKSPMKFIHSSCANFLRKSKHWSTGLSLLNKANICWHIMHLNIQKQVGWRQFEISVPVAQGAWQPGATIINYRYSFCQGTTPDFFNASLIYSIIIIRYNYLWFFQEENRINEDSTCRLANEGSLTAEDMTNILNDHLLSIHALRQMQNGGEESDNVLPNDGHSEGDVITVSADSHRAYPIWWEHVFAVSCIRWVLLTVPCVLLFTLSISLPVYPCSAVFDNKSCLV